MSVEMQIQSEYLHKDRSAKSLIMQPAERINITPNKKITKFLTEGLPLPAIHNADKVGHNNK